MSLIELLIALGLTVLLATAIFGAIRLQLQIRSTGEREVLKAQLTRSIFKQLQQDLSGVIFTPPQPEEDLSEDESGGLTLESESTGTSSGASSGTTLNTSGGASSGTTRNTSGGTSQSTSGSASMGTSSSASQSTTQSTSGTENAAPAEATPEAAISNPSAGLVGTATELTLHISRPIHPIRLASTQSSMANSLLTDEKAVSWFLNGSNGLSAPGSNSLTGTATGLSRLEGDRFTINAASLSNDQEQLTSLTKLLAPEVRQVSFRYFDGVNWVDSWDSPSMGRLPQAIEVTLGLMLDDPSQAQNIMGTIIQPPLETVTHVIRIPGVEPYVETMGL